MIPSGFESVKTDVAGFIDVAMIDLCLETNFWRTERVCAWELNVKREDSTFIPFPVSTITVMRMGNTVILVDQGWLHANALYHCHQLD